VFDERPGCQGRVDTEIPFSGGRERRLRRIRPPRCSGPGTTDRRGDIEGLSELVALAEVVDRSIHTAVSGLRECGYSWAEIADRLGISRQAAQQRWGASA
jgi:hypothetical protein